MTRYHCGLKLWLEPKVRLSITSDNARQKTTVLEAATEGVSSHDVLGDVADHLLITSVVAVADDVCSRVLIANGTGPPDNIESGSGAIGAPLYEARFSSTGQGAGIYLSGDVAVIFACVNVRFRSRT